MKDIVTKKIETLGLEARNLTEQREQLFNMAREIDIRLHQIAGAISELDSLLTMENKDEN